MLTVVLKTVSCGKIYFENSVVIVSDVELSHLLHVAICHMLPATHKDLDQILKKTQLFLHMKSWFK